MIFEGPQIRGRLEDLLPVRASVLQNSDKIHLFSPLLSERFQIKTDEL
jgi:hypothetical protein